MKMNRRFLLTILLLLLLPVIGRAQTRESLSLTPQMGWSSWNKFQGNINEDIIKSIADAMVASGLKDAGYTYINIDDCWHGKRDADGFIQADPKHFPHGIKALADIKPQRILDVATGTGDLAIEAYMRLRPASIVGIDISEQMMNVGRTKVERLGLSDAILFDRQNCCDLSFEDDSFDAVMAAFGVRNFEDLDKGLCEMLRVLRRGGRLMILELSTPEYFPARQGYRIYSKLIPRLGKIFTISRQAYDYLPKSISAFPQNRQMIEIMTINGFKNVSYKKLSWGTCSMYIGNK